MVGSHEPADVPGSGEGDALPHSYSLTLGHACVVGLLDSPAQRVVPALKALACSDESRYNPLLTGLPSECTTFIGVPLCLRSERCAFNNRIASSASYRLGAATPHAFVVPGPCGSCLHVHSLCESLA
jgi:hypothetical protein